MTYIDYLNDFNRWLESNALPGNAQLLYFRLLNVFNRAGWPEHVQVDTLRLMEMADSSDKRTVYGIRDKLAASGFITYRKGVKGKPTQFSLCRIRWEIPTKSCTESCTEYSTESRTESFSHIKTKKKTKKKTPPISPAGGQEGGGFLRFWQEYPRKMGRENARRAWEKLAPDQHLTGVILSAVERSKATDQWQREDGRYIPYPATWLNQRRWEDEPDTGTEALPPPQPYHYPTPEEDHVRKLGENQDWRDLI